MGFQTDLIVTPRARGMWELRETLIYVDILGKQYTIPQGFLCDLASIPPLAKEFMGPAAAGDVVYGPAAALHDWALCQDDIPSGVAHDLFKEALKACGASPALQAVMYHAVNRPKESEMDYEDITESEGHNTILGD